jgi:hypothetical protein
MLQKDGDILKKVRVFEWLKAELLSNVAVLFKAIIQGTEGAILDAIVNILIVTHVLARRLGIDFEQVDAEVEKRLVQHIKQDHEVERWFGDLSAFLDHYKATKR